MGCLRIVKHVSAVMLAPHLVMMETQSAHRTGRQMPESEATIRNRVGVQWIWSPDYGLECESKWNLQPGENYGENYTWFYTQNSTVNSRTEKKILISSGNKKRMDLK